MAGHAAYADECWRSSVMRLRNMSRQNEASIARHRALVERLPDVPALTLHGRRGGSAMAAANTATRVLHLALSM